MAAASTSTVYMHVGILVKSDGEILMIERFKHSENQED